MALLTLLAWFRMRRVMRLRPAIPCALGGILIVAASGVSAQEQTLHEYQVKAVFLFNFAQFVEWPAAAFDGPGQPLVIGLLGDNPLGIYLEETARGERVNNRPLEVRHYRRVDEAEECQILFISASETSRLGPILARLQGKSILLVGENDDFLRQGGMIRLATVGNRIRMAINVDAANAARLTISSKLLRAAEVVTASTR